MTLTIDVDARTETWLQQISAAENAEINDTAARLFKRAVLAARPRPVYDIEAIKANCAEFAAEDEALAESDLEHRAELLAQEDRA